MYKIMIVEDDAVIAAEIRDYLCRWDMQGHIAHRLDDIVGEYIRIKPQLIMDIVMAVNMGADDYLVKPVSMEVLVAKAQAMLRRTYDYRTPLLPTVQGARYDSAALYIEKDGVRVKLTPNEGKLLSCLISKRGKVVSREELMISLWDSDQFVDDNTLSVNMNRLRRKFEEVGVKNCIVTHRARGYALDG